MQDKVKRIRALLEEAIERKNALTRSPELDARHAYLAYSANDERTYVVDPSPRARTVREVLRIATNNGWPQEVEAALDRAEVTSLAALPDDDLEALLVHMRRLEDCVRNNLDGP